nr:NAD(P)-binding protein [Nannocystis pusilla]
MSAGPPTRPRKLAVFGGGLGSLSAVFALTELPGWRERYDITVYQIGWRLGGKARSGRNLRAHARSEALGHHVWFGWYDNAFALARRVYAETRRAPGAPLATFKEAFKPCDHLLLGTGDRSDRTPPWKMSLPRSDSLPGDGAAQPSVWHFAQTLLLWAIDCIPRLHPQYATWSAIVPRWPDASRSLWPALMRRAGGQGVRAYDGFDPQSPDYDGLLRRAAAAVHGEDAPKTSRQRRAWAQPLTHCGEHSLRALVGLGARQSHPQFTIMVDLALATVRGILHDGLDRAGFSAIDDQDLRAWLRRHGASEESLASTVLVALYADHMSYESGDVERPAAAAGALLRAALRRYLAFSGALYYTPAAGLGEVLFAPLYRLLRDRGVRFRFFHKLKHLCPDPKQPAVSAAVVGRQIELAPGVDDYEPLIKVKGLPCWPSRPLYSQIVLGDDPVIQAIDFEANESPEVEEVVLRAGVDFDEIVLGVPPPALAGAARELAARDPRWQSMLEHTHSIAAIGAQLWLSPTWPQLMGAPAQAGAGGIVRTELPRWVNLSTAAVYEGWPREHWPGAIASLSGPRPDRAADGSREPVRDIAETWLKSHPRALWPEASLAGADEFNWELLVDPQGRAAEHRLAAQHCWATQNASDRQIVTLPGDPRHRLAAGDSGFRNLWLAGDWVGGGLDLACAEGAVMAGLQAARALSGEAIVIHGERDGLDPE